MVMPRSRSSSIESSSWGTCVRASTAPVSSRMRSASVDLPWSMWAMIEKFRIRSMRRGRVVVGESTAVEWGQGRYERIAEQLLPVAEVVVEEARLSPGERVVDVGCGTGNAALMAAERGALVTGVDPAERLLQVATATAAERGLEAEFVSGV